MKKQSIIKLGALLFICCVMFGCGKETETATIYGTVCNKNGTPVPNVEVNLGTIASAVTGSDGLYEITFAGPFYNSYNLYVNYTYIEWYWYGGYTWHQSHEATYRKTITIRSGETKRFDIRLEKLTD